MTTTTTTTTTMNTTTAATTRRSFLDSHFLLLSILIFFVVANVARGGEIAGTETIENRPVLSWSAREKTCGFLSSKNTVVAGDDDVAVLEKVPALNDDDDEEEEENGALHSYPSEGENRVLCEEYGGGGANSGDVVDSYLGTESIKLKPKEHLYANSSAILAALGTNSSFEIVFVPTETMRNANASSAATIWTLEDSFENYNVNEFGLVTPSVDANEPCDEWPGAPPKFRVRYVAGYFLYGAENDAIIVETHMPCQHYAFVAPKELMFRKNPVFEDSHRWNNSVDNKTMAHYLAISLVVSFNGGAMSDGTGSLPLTIQALVNGQPLLFESTRNVQLGQSYSSPATNTASKFIRIGDHCCFDGYFKYFAMYNTTLSMLNAQTIYRNRLRARAPEIVLMNTPTVFDVVAEDDDSYRKREIELLVIDRDEMHDTFKVEVLHFPSIGRLRTCSDEQSDSYSLTYCVGARCTFCYYPPDQLRSAGTASTATFTEFIVLPFDENVTEYSTPVIDSARVRMVFNLLPTLVACVFRQDAKLEDVELCSTKTNTIVLNVTEDENIVVKVCANDTRTSSVSSENTRTNLKVDFIQFPLKGTAYSRESQRNSTIEVNRRVFACSLFSYSPVRDYHGSDIATIRIASTRNNITTTLTKQIVFNVINIEDTKKVVVKGEDALPVIEWMSRVDLSGSFTVSNAGVDSDAFLVRVQIVSECQNLVYLTNDTALDALTSIPLHRGDGGGDSILEFDATPSVANALLESMEYLNLYTGYDDNEHGYFNDTLTVRISSMVRAGKSKLWSEASTRLRVKPPSMKSYQLALMDVFHDDESNTRARSKLYGILAALCLLALQLLTLQWLKAQATQDTNCNNI